jgi:hypothetical protein
VEKEAYYNFRDTDFEKILNIESNSSMIYRNQFNEEIILETGNISSNYKTQYEEHNFVVGSTKHFYYDRKEIYATSDFPSYDIIYRFRRFPMDFEQAKENDFTEYPSNFIGKFNMFAWNGEVTNEFVYIDYNTETIEMLINGMDFNEVIVLNSNNMEEIVYPNYIKNVNVIYYDKVNGIIGFDDVNGKHWRIQN